MTDRKKPETPAIGGLVLLSPSGDATGMGLCADGFCALPPSSPKPVADAPAVPGWPGSGGTSQYE